MTRRAVIFAAASMLLMTGLAAAFHRPVPPLPERLAPQQVRDRGFTSSDTCRACHPREYASWYASYHRTMTQVASPEAILAPMEAMEVEGRGRVFRTEVRGDELWAEDVDAHAFVQRKPAPRISAPIVMITGSHHMQIYWVRQRDGMMKQLSWAWLERDRRWVPGEDLYFQPPGGRVGVAAHWNTNCIKCHSTGGEPRLRVKGLQRADTRVAELGIACESCHGPAEEHVRANREPLRRYAYHFAGWDDPTIANPRKLPHPASSEVCAQCHSDRVDLAWDVNRGSGFRPNGDFGQHFGLKHFDTTPVLENGKLARPALFWDDGTSRVTGREYTGMRESGCFTVGEISCDSCHSMHDSHPNDQIARNRHGDAACFQCHAGYASRIEEHTHHPVGSSGAACQNCHMPYTTLGLLDVTRSHRIDSPSVAMSAEHGRPNACSLCHVDRTLDWASAHLAAWYGQPKTELSAEHREVPAIPLWLLTGDAAQRSVAAWHLGWPPAIEASGEQGQAALLARVLDDPYSGVRYVGGRALARFPGFEDFSYDYLMPEDARADAVAAALAIANGSGAAAGLAPADVARLEAQRDDRPVWIKE